MRYVVVQGHFGKLLDFISNADNVYLKLNSEKIDQLLLLLSVISLKICNYYFLKFYEN